MRDGPRDLDHVHVIHDEQEGLPVTLEVRKPNRVELGRQDRMRILVRKGLRVDDVLDLVRNTAVRDLEESDDPTEIGDIRRIEGRDVPHHRRDEGRRRDRISHICRHARQQVANTSRLLSSPLALDARLQSPELH